jgi:hypothetical protein
MIRLPKLGIAMLALAFVLVLALPVLAADTTGKVKSIESDKNLFVVADNAGTNWTFTLDKDAKVLINDKESKLADLQAGDAVTVTHEKKGDKEIASMVRCTRK